MAKIANSTNCWENCFIISFPKTFSLDHWLHPCPTTLSLLLSSCIFFSTYFIDFVFLKHSHAFLFILASILIIPYANILISLFKSKILIVFIFSRQLHARLLLNENLRVLLWLRVHHRFNVFRMFGMLLYSNFNLFLIYLLIKIELVNMFWIV